MRKVEIKNDIIKDSLLRRDELIKQVLKIEEEAAKLNERGKEIQVEYEALHSKLVREVEKTEPALNEEKKNIELGEYEDISRIDLGKEGDEKGKVYLTIADRLEEFKAGYAQAKEQSKKDNGDSDTQDKGDGEIDPEQPANRTE